MLNWNHQITAIVIVVACCNVATAKYCPLGADVAFVAVIWALPDVDVGDLLEFELIVLLAVLLGMFSFQG